MDTTKQKTITDYRTRISKDQKEIVVYSHHCKRDGCHVRWESKNKAEICPGCDNISISTCTVLGYEYK